MVVNEYFALKIHNSRLHDFEEIREHSERVKDARENKRQWKLYEPLRKIRR